MTETAGAPDRRSLLQQALRSIDELQARLEAVERRQSEPIAIIGLGCRLPGDASDPDAYWRVLAEGRDAIREMPSERRHYFASQPDVAAAFNETTWYGGFLNDLDRFDPAFFGISPREALTMDPQQRLVLAVAWEALERAGQAPDGLNGSATGVFIGVTTSDYSHLSRQGGADQLDVYTATGGTLNAVAGRLSYTLGLQGPCVAIDTACSSSLVAVHLACQSLRTGESSLALAGGVNVVLLPESYLCCQRWGMLASDGRCKTFDARADGFVRSEGCGIIVLKRLADAQAAGDPVLAVIRGSAVNQDGRSSGLTVPNGLAQQRVIRAALASAQVEPAAVSYVETHGAGTALGDPIEVEALGAVLGEGRAADQPLTIGAVKTNLGHCEAAAGIAGLIKVVLSLQHRQLPPHLHLTERSPKIPWPSFPIAIPDRLQPWSSTAGPRIAGVSSFGLSGTNAHIILAEAPPAPPAAPAQPRSVQLLTLSAKSALSLRQLADDYATWLANPAADVTLADLCATAASGRAHFAHRLAVVAETPDQLRASLVELAAGQRPIGALQGELRPGVRPRLAFLFTGHGAQYDDMARRLYEHEPVFRQAVEECATLLQPLLERPLLSVLYPTPATARGDETALRASLTYGLPALFTIQYGLIQLWRAWGVTPALALGHSAGEYAAAHLAGVFSLADALKLVAARGRLMQSLAVEGVMVVVLAAAERLAELIAPYGQTVAIAAINGPESVVISGRRDDVEAILARLTTLAIEWRRLPIAQASHSPLVEPILDEFEQVAATVAYREPPLSLISSRTGGPVGPNTVTSAAYWRDHLRRPVEFLAAMQAAHTAGVTHYIELGPHPTLLGMGRNCVPDGSGTWLPSLRQGRDEWVQLLESLGQLYVDGLQPYWPGLEPAGRRPIVPLPTYPFARESYWLSPPPPAPSQPAPAVTDPVAHPLLGQRLRSPLLKGIVYQAALGATSPAYLSDHRVHGLAIVPGVAYLELALAAGVAQARGPVLVEQLQIHEPIVLPEAGTGLIQTALTDGEDGSIDLQIFWQAPAAEADAADQWTLKASGRLRLGAPLSEPATTPIASSALGGGQWPAIAVDDYYERLAAVGLDYGPRFRGIHQLHGVPGEAWAWLSLPPTEAPAASRYQLHPALLDAAFQVLGAALPSTDDVEHFYMPVGMAGVRLGAPAVAAAWCQVQVAPAAEARPAQVMASLTLYSQTGQPVAAIEQIRIQRTSRQQLQRRLRRPINDLLYDLAWQAGPPLTPSAPGALDGWYLILADRQGLGVALADRLAEQGGQSLIVSAGEHFAAHGARHWQVDPLAPADLPRVLAAARAAGLTSLAGVVVLWALDGVTPETEPVAAEALTATLRLTSGVLHLAQALEPLAGTTWPPLWLVTRGAQTVGTSDEPPAVDGAALWGLGPSLAQELPGLRYRLIDLDPLAELTSVALLVDELRASDGETRVAWRGRQRFVQRLLPHRPPAEIEPARPLSLTITERGLLENLTLLPQTFPQPGPGEVTIAVRATGLNFRDVMNALGILPGNADAFGLECAGDVVAVGPDVSTPRVGQAVLAVTGRGYQSYVVTPARLTVTKPAALSYAAAATLPIAFLTAAYGLFDLAQLKVGDRVLVHAAAGGVGLATIQLARRAGAVVLATAGSERKRRYLQALGVQHVFSSRRTDFADQLMAATDNQGVDLVINSLSDEFIPASLAVLRPHGHFLELGRRGVWGAEQVAALRPDVTYTPYELGTLLVESPDRFRALLSELMVAVERGELHPLPRRCFSFQRAVDAFRYMAQARHIGKVVVVHPELTAAEHSTPLVRPAASYLITGGLGGVGLLLADWLIDQGARHLVLVGRRPPTAAGEHRLATWRAAGVRVATHQVDLTDASQLDDLMTHLHQDWPPLRGVMHAAAVLDDGLALQQTPERASRVLAPKLAGAWRLAASLEGAALDFLVLFSSASAVLGSPGQTVYAAANASLDALAHWLTDRGQPALSINWGAWGEVGQAAALGERERQRWQEAGIGFFAPAAGLQALALALAERLTRLTVVQVDWSRLRQRYGTAGVPPLLAELVGAAPPSAAAPAVATPASEPVLERLRAADGAARLGLLTDYVQAQVARVLRVARPETIQIQQPLQDYGFDSLMAVELRNRLQTELAVTLPLRSLLDGNSVASLAVQLIAVVPAVPDPDPPTSESEPALSPAEAEQLLADLDRLSDDEVDALLATLAVTDKE